MCVHNYLRFARTCNQDFVLQDSSSLSEEDKKTLESVFHKLDYHSLVGLVLTLRNVAAKLKEVCIYIISLYACCKWSYIYVYMHGDH